VVSDVVINLTNALSGIEDHLSLYYVPPTCVILYMVILIEVSKKGI